jgi:uncharacterized membrane protein
MRRAFEAYQNIAPALLTPLAAWLWWRHYDGNGALATIAVVVPIAYAYVVPGIGTNLLQVWEFDTRLRLGRFRPHHGFVFGSATAMLVLPVIGAPAVNPTVLEALARGTAVAGILGILNWLYDALAIRAGFLKVYNQPWADGRDAWTIASDYAPWFFGGFGLIYAGGLKLAEGALQAEPATSRAVAVGLAILAATLTLPTLGYVIQSYARHGHHGCRPITRAEPS